MEATNGMRLNDDLSNSTLDLRDFRLERIILPSSSSGEGWNSKMGEIFSEISQLAQNQDNVLINLLKYTFIIRYFSNNQIIVVQSLLRTELPLNLHLSTQALSSGLKPFTESYQQNDLDLDKVEAQETIFKIRIPERERRYSYSENRKLRLSGYSNNLFLNDPMFCQIFLFSLSCFLGTQAALKIKISILR